MRKLAQNIDFKPNFCLPDTFLAEKLRLRAFKTSRKAVINFLKPAVSSKKIGLAV